jgi:hypothetical protein
LFSPPQIQKRAVSEDRPADQEFQCTLPQSLKQANKNNLSPGSATKKAQSDLNVDRSGADERGLSGSNKKVGGKTPQQMIGGHYDERVSSVSNTPQRDSTARKGQQSSVVSGL